MKILFYRYGSICEPDLRDTFALFGFDVYEMDHEVTNKNLSHPQSIRLVSDYLLSTTVDLVFSVNFYPFLSEVCNIFHLPYLCWIVDSPVLELYSISIKNPCNRIFLFDKCTYDEIHPLNPDCVFHLPLAVNCESKQTVIRQSSESTRNSFRSDISFVGSLYTEKCLYDKITFHDEALKGYLEGLMEAQLHVYGYFFIEECLTLDLINRFIGECPDFFKYPADSFLSDKTTLAQLYMGPKISAMERLAVMKRLSANYRLDIYTGSDTSTLPKIHNRGFAKTLSEMPLIFHESQINLNITSKSIRNGIPLRAFDILGCEGFMISNYQTELLDYFEAGVHFDMYSCMEELEEKVAFYRNHPSLCREIAHNGYENVKNFHTYPIRLAQMFELALGKNN